MSRGGRFGAERCAARRGGKYSPRPSPTAGAGFARRRCGACWTAGGAGGGAAAAARPGGWRGRRARRTGGAEGVRRGILHKTELGAVELGLVGEQEVARAARRMSRRLRAAGLRAESFVVQRQLGGGVEMLAGISADPLLGPLVACGAGAAVEVLGDVAVRLAPITDREAARMVRSLSTFPLLDGYRGAPRRTWRSRTYCSGSPRSPTPIPRWPSSTATRSWSPSEARPQSTPACASSAARAAMAGARGRATVSSFYGRQRRPAPDANTQLTLVRSPHAN